MPEALDFGYAIGNAIESGFRGYHGYRSAQLEEEHRRRDGEGHGDSRRARTGDALAALRTALRRRTAGVAGHTHHPHDAADIGTDPTSPATSSVRSA
jgi:hypothetical protein